jgi:hypothetical protein
MQGRSILLDDELKLTLKFDNCPSRNLPTKLQLEIRDSDGNVVFRKRQNIYYVKLQVGKLSSWYTEGHFLTSPLAPRGDICPLGLKFTPSFTPRGDHSLLFRRIEGQTENFTPRG